MAKKTKKVRLKLRTIRLLLVIILVIGGGFGFYYSRYIAPTAYKVSNYTVNATSLPEQFTNFKIGFISDLNLHQAEDITRLEEIVETINAQSYDMLIFGGDLYDGEHFDQASVVAALQKMESKYGKFAVQGEKDLVYANETIAILHDGGFEVLRNEYRKIYYNDTTIALFGLENNGDIAGLLTSENEEMFKLVVVHQPDYFTQSAGSKVDLQLSGHSLGGYIRFPFIGSPFSKDLTNNYEYGRYNVDSSTLIVSNGLGLEATHNARLFTSNQILTITLGYEKPKEVKKAEDPVNENQENPDPNGEIQTPEGENSTPEQNPE